MKHIKLFEEFDLDSFLENPNAGTSGPEIHEGDYIRSIRGFGQVVDVTGDFVKVNLSGSDSPVPTTIPLDMVTKISKEEFDSIGEIGPELKRIADEADDWYEELKIMVTEQDMTISEQTAEKIVDFLENALLDLISMSQKNSNLAAMDDYSRLVNTVSLLSEIAYTVDEELGQRIDAIAENMPG